MILIITNSLDKTTNEVIDWLLKLDVPFTRIDEDKEIEFQLLKMSQVQIVLKFKINKREYSISDFKYIWYRRGSFEFKLKDFIEPNSLFNRKLLSHINGEKTNLYNFIYKLFEGKCLNNPIDNRLNKLEILCMAQNAGLKIPKSCIINSKVKLLQFFDECSELIISKSLNQGVFISDDQSSLSTLTTNVTREMINNMNSEFYPSFFQEKIIKAFELRIFYLNKTFYSSAIFSQNDPLTSTDFRNYNRIKPNRVLSYRINKLLEKKLTNLLKSINLNSGSIDIIIDQKGDEYFLEINPIGQFSQVSKPCNYYLEYKVAKYLENHAK